MRCYRKFLLTKAPEQCLSQNSALKTNDELLNLVIFWFNGAEGGTRTRTDYSTRPSNVRGYQLRHLGLLDFGFRLWIAGFRA